MYVLYNHGLSESLKVAKRHYNVIINIRKVLAADLRKSVIDKDAILNISYSANNGIDGGSEVIKRILKL